MKYERHEKSLTRLYRVWIKMKERCYSKKHNRYNSYGGRGIKVCSEWLHSFSNFEKDMASRYKQGFSLGRIDNDGNYSQSNCRWETRKQQQNNIRTNVVLIYLGESLTVSQWAEKLGIPRKTIYSRISSKRNLKVEDILRKD